MEKTFFISHLLLLFFLSACTANLRPQKFETSIPDQARAKAIQILEESFEVQGFSHLKNFEGYEIVAEDDWQGSLGTIGKLWPEKNIRLKLTYPTDRFEGEVEYLSGEYKGFKVRLKKGQYSETMNDEELTREFYPKEHDAYVVFGIEAFKFFSEMVVRILTADHQAYVEETTYRGQDYHVIFATWGKETFNEEYDQYLIYVNKKTKLIDRAEYTIRENYMAMPGDGFMYGNVEYLDYKEVNGMLIPHTHLLFDFDPEEDLEDYLHK